MRFYTVWAKNGHLISSYSGVVMKKHSIIFLISLASILSGCFHLPAVIETTSLKGKSAEIKVVRVDYQRLAPLSVIDITRAGSVYLEITEAHKLIAKQSIGRLDAFFSKGLKESFPIEAEKYGLRVSNEQGIPYMKIRVGKTAYYCSDSNCLPSMELKGDLFDASGVLLWNFTASVYPTTTLPGKSESSAQLSPISEIASIPDETFNRFQTALLEAMKKDGFISKHSDTHRPVPKTEDAEITPSDIPQQLANSNKSASINKPINKVDVISFNNSAPANIAELNRILSSLLTKELRSTCIKEVNGLATINKDPIDSSEQDINYNLLIEPEILDDNSSKNGKIIFHAYLHRLPNLKSSPNKENMVWDTPVAIDGDASSISKDKLGKIAHILVKQMATNNFIPATCNGK